MILSRQNQRVSATNPSCDTGSCGNGTESCAKSSAWQATDILERAGTFGRVRGPLETGGPPTSFASLCLAASGRLVAINSVRALTGPGRTPPIAVQRHMPTPSGSAGVTACLLADHWGLMQGRRGWDIGSYVTVRTTFTARKLFESLSQLSVRVSTELPGACPYSQQSGRILALSARLAELPPFLFLKRIPEWPLYT